MVEAGVLQNERSHDRKNAKPWELLPDSIRRAYMRVVSGVRLAFQAGTGEFEPLRPLQFVLGRFPTIGVEPSVVIRHAYNRSLKENPW